MNKWTRRMAMGLAGAVLAGSLAVGAVAEEKDYSDVEFRVAWWGNDTRHMQTNQLVEEFEKAYPGLKIDVEYSGWGDYWTKLSTQAAGADLPDVIQMDYSYINSYAEAGLLLDLKPYVESGALDLSHVSETTVSAGMVGDQLVAVVTGTNAPAYLYNKAALEEVGVTIDQAPTLDEFLAVAKAVYEKTGSKTGGVSFECYVRSRGEQKYSDDGKSAGFAAETLVEFWKMDQAARKEGYFVDVQDPTKESDEENLTSGTVWCVSEYSNFLESLEEKTKMELGMFTMPSDQTVAAYMKPNMFWSVYSETENPEVAVAFLNEYTNGERTYDICGTDRGMPISSEIRAYLAPTFTDAQQRTSDFLMYLEDGHVAPIYKPEPARSAEAWNFVSEACEQVSYHVIAEEDYLTAAQQVIEQMNAVLSAE